MQEARMRAEIESQRQVKESEKLKQVTEARRKSWLKMQKGMKNLLKTKRASK